MGNKYYQPGAERAEKVGDLFATIAPRYDLINDLQSFGLHRAWKRRLVHLAAPRHAERALDVCCGTGDIALSFARRGAEVVGLDFSEPMLAIATAKASSEFRVASSALNSELETRNSEPSPPRFIRGDAQEIPFPDNQFDIVSVGYGLRNLASWEAGLREMLRVAKPGARLLVLDFGKPDDALWRLAYFSYLRWGVPIFGKVFCHDSQTHSYIFESLKNYPAQRGVAEKMRALGCEDVRIVNLLGGVMSINYARKAPLRHARRE